MASDIESIVLNMCLVFTLIFFIYLTRDIELKIKALVTKSAHLFST